MLPTKLPSLSARTRPGVRLLLVAASVAVILAACSSTASTSIHDGGPVPPIDVAPAATAAPAGPATAQGAPVKGGSGGTSSGGNDALADTGPLVVKTGSMSLDVRSVDEAVLQARGRITGVGGYVSDSQRANQGENATALITYRIPAARWDEALDALRGLAQKVTSEQTRAVEVTGQVVDLDARIDNLRATERALQAIMAQATRISDVLDVQNQLTSVRGEIEQLTAQRTHLADQAAMGTLAVSFSVPVVAVADATSGWNLSAEFDRAVAQLLQLGQGVAVAGLWLAVVGVPVLIALLLVAGLIYLLARRFGLRRPTPGSGAGPGTDAGVAPTNA